MAKFQARYYAILRAQIGNEDGLLRFVSQKQTIPAGRISSSNEPSVLIREVLRRFFNARPNLITQLIGTI